MRRRKRNRSEEHPDRRLHETGFEGGTGGTFIDSFENMPGAQNTPPPPPRRDRSSDG